MIKTEAIEYLEKDIKLHEVFNETKHQEKAIEALNMAIDALTKEPKTRHFKVVRCRECEHWKCNPNTKNYGACGKVSYDDFEVVMEGDDFCSYGIRIK